MVGERQLSTDDLATRIDEVLASGASEKKGDLFERFASDLLNELGFFGLR